MDIFFENLMKLDKKLTIKDSGLIINPHYPLVLHLTPLLNLNVAE